MAPNFVYDNLPVPGAKTDNPEQVVREASVPTNQKTTAAEVNELTAAATGLRTAVNEVAPFYNVMRYANGATIGDGVTDATDALEAALVAAGAAAQTVVGLETSVPEVVLPAGGFIQTRPLFVPAGVSVRGAGPGQSVLAWKSGTYGYSFLAADADNGANFLRLTGAYGGGALVCDYSVGDATTHTYVDLSQYQYGRLPAGSWTIRFARRFTNIAAEAPQGLQIFFVGAFAPWSGFPTPATALSLYFDLFASDGSMRLDYRFHNVLTTVTVPFVTTPVLVDNTWYEFEIAYDDSAGTLRVFLNGELWTRGALTLTGSGPDADSSKLRQWSWERMTLGSTVFAGYPSEDTIFPSPLGALKGFHLRDGVAHTASYVASPLTDPTGGVSTFLLCNFDQVFKGNLVAAGINNATTVYLRSVRNGVVTQHPRVQVRDLAIIGGSGIRFEFATEGLIENVLVRSPGVGIELVRNCYLTHLTVVRVLNGFRAGVVNASGAYNIFNGVNTSCPIGFALYEANVLLMGCEIAAHGGGTLGMSVTGGTCAAVGFAVDLEENVGATPWVAALFLEDTITFESVGATLYSPPDRPTKSPVLIRNTSGATGYNFRGGFFQAVPSNVSLTRLVGSSPSLDNKIVIAGASNANASPLCDVAGQAHDPYNRPRGNFQISASATTHQVNLPSVGFGTAYLVLLTPTAASGGAAAGATRVRSVAKSDDHFIVTVEAAPGGSETADFDYAVEVGN